MYTWGMIGCEEEGVIAADTVKGRCGQGQAWTDYRNVCHSRNCGSSASVNSSTPNYAVSTNNDSTKSSQKTKMIIVFNLLHKESRRHVTMLDLQSVAARA